MTLQNNGAISFSNLQTEFGGSNPISLSEYYRGGAYVPSSSSANIPTSGAIKLSNFYGATAIDLIPNAVNWVDFNVTEYDGMHEGQFNLTATGGSDQTITGINQSIILSFDLSNFYISTSGSGSGSGGCSIFKNGIEIGRSTVNGLICDVTVNNNDIIGIGADASYDGYYVSEGRTECAGTVTIKNKTVSNTVLDTVNFVVAAQTTGF